MPEVRVVSFILPELRLVRRGNSHYITVPRSVVQRLRELEGRRVIVEVRELGPEPTGLGTYSITVITWVTELRLQRERTTYRLLAPAGKIEQLRKLQGRPVQVTVRER